MTPTVAGSVAVKGWRDKRIRHSRCSCPSPCARAVRGPPWPRLGGQQCACSQPHSRDPTINNGICQTAWSSGPC